MLWSIRKLNHSIDRPGMNRRDISESLDDKIMGDMACMAVWIYLYRKYSKELDIIVYDEQRIDNFSKPDPGWDIKIKEKKKLNASYKTISIKSSRLPQKDTLQQAIEKRDFKILCNNKCIEEDITADIEIQVYYEYNKTQLGALKISKQDLQNVLKNLHQPDNFLNIIIEKLNIKNRWDSCYLVGFNTRKRIISHSKNLQNPTWTSYRKKMWIAPLKEGFSLENLLFHLDDA